MPGAFELSGAQSKKPSAWGSLVTETYFEGLFTNRAQFHPGGTQIENKFYNGRPGQLLGGRNVELNNLLALQRRPGLTPLSCATYPTAPLYSFAFPQLDGSIRVIVDLGGSGSMAVSSVANTSGGNTVYTGTFPLGGANAYVGLIFTVSGFANAGNNGSFKVVASTITTLTLANSNGISETNAGTASTAGSVWWDEQTGSCAKQLLFSKAAGAGQTSFVAVDGILYAGDGVETWTWNPGNAGANGSVFGFGLTAPTVAPTVVITESGSASVSWTASTEFSTMGLIFDTTSGTIWQLQSVNASTTNTTQFGTSGSGQPPWNQIPGGTTADTTGGGTITWTNKGPIVAWTANTTYNNATIGGTTQNPCAVFDPVTKAVYLQSTANATGISGHTVPSFKKALGQHTNDGSCVWIWVGPGIGNAGLAPWLSSQSYPAIGSVTNNDAATAVVEPSGLQNGLPAAPNILYLQGSGGGTSGAGYTPFGTTPIAAGNLVDDNDLIWMSLGSFTWAATTSYTQWTANNTVFSAIVDLNNNFQVCIQSGVSGSVQPTWGAGYGVTTTDGSAIWVNVGSAVAWATATKWYLPVQGFFPPGGATPFGGASVLDNNVPADVEFTINSGKSGVVEPTFGAIGTYTDDNGTSFTLSQVSVVGGTTTYTGVGLSALAGQQLIISGFTNAGNNGYVVALTAGSTSFTVKTTSQVNETHAGVAKNGLIWFNEQAFSAQSLAFTKGYSYAYSYKSRSLTDFYSVNVAGTSQPPIPPGLSSPLPAPTGSLTGDVSSASPATLTPIGPNPGAVLTISGPVSTNPAVDTIVIWRSADGGGSSNMFELTEIPNLPNGGPGTWSFRDFLPDVPSTIGGVSYPGLNILLPAPIDGVNNPPPSNFRPQEYNFDRIWGISGNEVVFSGGPDTAVGNPNTSFNTADEFTFLANPTRAVKVGSVLLVFTPSSIEVIAGGPSTASFFTYTLVRGVGMLSWNALDVFAGEVFFFGADNVLRVLSPNLTLTSAAFAIEDQLANMSVSGVQDTIWNPANVYLAVLQSGNDNMIALADGATGWYRLNPRQQNGSVNGTEPIWSPFAAITNGCKMVVTVEVVPGIKKLLVGATTGGKPILKRDLTVFTDNGAQYDAFFVQGTLTLARRGELAIARFVEADFSGVNYQPTVSYLLNEAFGSASKFTSFTLAPQLDPPLLYGALLAPVSYSPNRYYFAGVGSLARAIYLTVMVDFGTTPNPDSIYNMTVNGTVIKGQ
jgi:hypothetical protein